MYDGVVGPWFLPTFATASGLHQFDYVVLMPPVEVCVERVLTRQNHGFQDEAATRKMHSEFAASTIAKRHLLMDLPTEAGAVATAIAVAQAAGRLRYTLG